MLSLLFKTALVQPKVEEVTTPPPTYSETIENNSEICWKYANQGLSLLNLSSQEQSGSFSRQLYVHGIIYLIHALPKTITRDEIASIRASLANVVVEEEESYFNHKETHRPGALNKIISYIILRMFVFVSVIIPWIQALFMYLYELNNQYHVMERLFRYGMSLQYGKMGKMVERLSSWFITNLSGGIYDGLSQGLKILGLNTTCYNNPGDFIKKKR